MLNTNLIFETEMQPQMYEPNKNGFMNIRISTQYRNLLLHKLL